MIMLLTGIGLDCHGCVGFHSFSAGETVLDTHAIVYLHNNTERRRQFHFSGNRQFPSSTIDVHLESNTSTDVEILNDAGTVSYTHLTLPTKA